MCRTNVPAQTWQRFLKKAMQMQFSEENNLFSLSVLPEPECKRLFLCFYSVRLGTFLNEPLEKNEQRIITMTFSGTSFNKISYINSSLNERNIQIVSK